MSQLIQGNPWVYAIVQDPGGNEQFLGQTDEEMNISFIPIFLDKDAAGQCLPFLVREKGLKYEGHSIRRSGSLCFKERFCHIYFGWSRQNPGKNRWRRPRMKGAIVEL